MTSDKYHGGVPTDHHAPWRVPPAMFHAARVTQARMMSPQRAGSNAVIGSEAGIGALTSFNGRTTPAAVLTTGDVNNVNGATLFNVQNVNYAGGAKGDATTDDTAAIQAAINAAKVNGGTVYFPTPTASYAFSNLVLYAGVKLLGPGRPTGNGTLIASKRTNGQPAIQEAPLASNPGGGVGIQIEDLFLNCANTAGDGINLGNQLGAGGVGSADNISSDAYLAHVYVGGVPLTTVTMTASAWSTNATSITVSGVSGTLAPFQTLAATGLVLGTCIITVTNNGGGSFTLGLSVAASGNGSGAVTATSGAGMNLSGNAIGFFDLWSIGNGIGFIFGGNAHVNGTSNFYYGVWAENPVSQQIITYDFASHYFGTQLEDDGTKGSGTNPVITCNGNRNTFHGITSSFTGGSVKTSILEIGSTVTNLSVRDFTAVGTGTWTDTIHSDQWVNGTGFVKFIADFFYTSDSLADTWQQFSATGVITQGGPAIPNADSLAFNDLAGWSVDPSGLLTSGGIAIPAVAKLYLCRVPISAVTTISHVYYNLTTVGAGTLTNCYIGAYKSDGTFVAQTADQTAVWETGGTTGIQKIALAATFTPLGADDFVWLAFYIGTNSGGALPKFACAEAGSAGMVNIGATIPRSRFGSIALANTATLTSISTNSVGNDANAFFIGML